METPKRGEPLLEHPRANRIRPGDLRLPDSPRRAGTSPAPTWGRNGFRLSTGRPTIGSPPGGAVEQSETEGGSPGSYGFARGFCISQVPPPGGDKPRPYMGTEGFRFTVGEIHESPAGPGHVVGADALGGPAARDKGRDKSEE